MKVLLDENLPHDLRHLLPGHDVYTVAYMGWSGIENGALLRTAGAAGIDVIRAKTNKLEDIRPLVPEVLSALAALAPNTFVRVG